MNISKFPIDFELLEKGDILTTELIEEAMGCPATDRRFNFEMLALSALIEKNTGFNVVSQNYTELRILTDEESVEHNAKIFRQGTNKFNRAAQIARNIDIDQLSNAAATKLQRQMLNQGRIRQAMRRERRLIAAEERATKLVD